jgi:hypothetical protein
MTRQSQKEKKRLVLTWKLNVEDAEPKGFAKTNRTLKHTQKQTGLDQSITRRQQPSLPHKKERQQSATTTTTTKTKKTLQNGT